MFTHLHAVTDHTVTSVHAAQRCKLLHKRPRIVMQVVDFCPWPGNRKSDQSDRTSFVLRPRFDKASEHKTTVIIPGFVARHKVHKIVRKRWR